VKKHLYFGLVIGAAVAGAAAAFYYVKDSERKRAEEEIATMREYFARKEQEANLTRGMTGMTAEHAPKDETSEKKQKSKEIRDYQKIVREKYKQKQESAPEGPVVISPDEFGENPGYDSLSMTFYADNIVADENDDIVEDVNDCIGFESLAHIGEYEPDILYVRNDRLRVYYEITRDLRNYADVAGELPHRLEVT
jgi:hypothetical protein